MSEDDKNKKEDIKETKSADLSSKKEEKVEKVEEVVEDSPSVKADSSEKVEEVVEATPPAATESSEKEEKVEEVVEDSISEDSVELPFIIGTKVGMTQVFAPNGNVYPVTVIQAGPCNVTQIKSIKNDGYDAVQLGYENVKDTKGKKPLIGHFSKAKTNYKKHLKEFRCDNLNDIELGTEITLNQFSVGDMLTVTGKSKGKAFAGHMKRHNFSGGRASHGKNSVMRKAGSIGAGTSPGRVWKGTRMAGRMGNDTITTKNLELVKLDYENNLLFISGAVPGSNKNIVYISRSN